MHKHHVGRREFLKTTATAAFMAGLASPLMATVSAAEKSGVIKKAIQINMLPKELSDSDKFALAKACGFEAIEAYPMDDLNAAAKLGQTARDAGLEIHSVSFGGWDAPMSSSDPAVIEKGLKNLDTGLRSTKAMGANVMLLVPAVVNENTGYVEAYKNSQANVKKILPLAQELEVVVAVENVWNKFLLSPIEFARYVDEFESPWLKAYFDCGNVVIFGYPEDWIKTLGTRIAKIHLKDFKRDGYQWTNLRDGDVNWPKVRAALDEIGYSGYVTPELKGGDEAYLRDLSERIDLILAGK